MNNYYCPKCKYDFKGKPKCPKCGQKAKLIGQKTFNIRRGKNLPK